MQQAGHQEMTLPEPVWRGVEQAIRLWQDDGLLSRLWARDAGLWTGGDEAQWLGWLRAPVEHAAQQERFDRLAAEVRRIGCGYALLLGMGGSSLCPEVLARTFAPAEGSPQLLVLDSTDPAQVRRFEDAIDPARTVFIVSSKSGTTLEPNIFLRYFYDLTVKRFGPEEAAARFIAITDPGSALDRLAQERGFRHVFHGVASIGGRYSALSNFGLVPAAIMGLDVARLLGRAREMAELCGPAAGVAGNPGVVLGLAMGIGCQHGCDKVTVAASPPIESVGGWLEQLLGESTGKAGTGLVPVDGEQLADPGAYAHDRLFVYLRLRSHPDPAQDEAIDRLEADGKPVVRLSLEDPYDLGAEFFRWEMATAVCGAVLEINPFDQPDVEASKLAARRLTAEYETAGRLPHETPLARHGTLELFADPVNRAALSVESAGAADVPALLSAHLRRLLPGNYFALLAYVDMNHAHDAELQRIRNRVRDVMHVATCLGYGPRFLHSTGQAYKGGPNAGVFLQITCQDLHDVAIPGQRYTFGIVKAAQARGDLEVLAARGRRALRVHIAGDPLRGLEQLRELVERATEG